MSNDWIFAGVGLAGLAVIFFGIARIRSGRPFSGSLRFAVGLALTLIAAMGYFVAMNLGGYHRFSHETPLAELQFKQTGPQQFRVLFTPEEGSSQVLELAGDEWQLDARVLKLTGFASWIGLDGGYRLDRLSGRYRDLARERSSPRSVHQLRGAEKGLDTWIIVQRYSRWLPLVDATYGNATYLPMADGAWFDVHVGNNGLIPRPKNDAAEKAVRTSR